MIVPVVRRPTRQPAPRACNAWRRTYTPQPQALRHADAHQIETSAARLPVPFHDCSQQPWSPSSPPHPAPLTQLAPPARPPRHSAPPAACSAAGSRRRAPGSPPPAATPPAAGHAAPAAPTCDALHPSKLVFCASQTGVSRHQTLEWTTELLLPCMGQAAALPRNPPPAPSPAPHCPALSSPALGPALLCPAPARPPAALPRARPAAAAAPPAAPRSPPPAPPCPPPAQPGAPAVSGVAHRGTLAHGADHFSAGLLARQLGLAAAPPTIFTTTACEPRAQRRSRPAQSPPCFSRRDEPRGAWAGSRGRCPPAPPS